MERKVIVLAGSVKDYSAAARFGKLTYISSEKNMLNVGRIMAKFLDQFMELSAQGVEKPYIVMMGHGLYMSILMLAAFEVWDEVELLIWDSKKRIYNLPILLSKQSIHDYKTTAAKLNQKEETNTDERTKRSH